jgi:8-oxo-dGTP pyrophosphatase MutT (NUDIX family)
LLEAQDIFLPDHDLHVVRLTYSVSLEGTPSLGNEHQKYAWVSAAESLKLDVDPYLRTVLEEVNLLRG